MTSQSRTIIHFHRRLRRGLERLRLRLSAAEALTGLCVLGALTGLLAGLVIMGFRGLVTLLQEMLTGAPGAQGFEALEWYERVLLTTGGGAAIGLYLRYLAGSDTRTGIIYVIERTVYHQGYLPLRNALTQLIAATLAIGCGHSVGREGPSVHLGATAGSYLGQSLRLPNNTMRTLVACGTAAAIGASFNTPLAGVAFAMEVVVMEYTIASFLPVILAAVTATTLSRLAYGHDAAFAVPELAMRHLGEIGPIVLTALVIGTIAAGYNYTLSFVTRRFSSRGIVLRTTVGGLVVGLLAIGVPQIMGVGYETVTAALHNELTLGILVAVAAGKLVASCVVLGLGVPAGLIGPLLVIGATVGGAMGYLGQLLLSDAIATPAFYALLGMGAMMGASLRAPLAALTAMLELTANPSIILPGMLAIVVATLTTGELFRTDSIFLTWLRDKGLDPRRNPLMHAFGRLGIVRVVDRRLEVLPRHTTRKALDAALEQEPRWILVTDPEQDGAVIALVPVTDLLQRLQEDDPRGAIDLLTIPARRLQVAAIDLRASLREALNTLRRENAEALYVTQTNAPGLHRYFGAVTRRDIENQYL